MAQGHQPAQLLRKREESLRKAAEEEERGQEEVEKQTRLVVMVHVWPSLSVDREKMVGGLGLQQPHLAQGSADQASVGAD